MFEKAKNFLRNSGSTSDILNNALPQNNIIKKLYYMVPPCPNCGNFHTGRFFKKKKKQYENEWIVKEGLKNGEIMAEIDNIDPENNVFCMDCGFTWSCEVESLRLSSESIEKQKMMRGTNAILAAIEKGEEEEKQTKKPGLIRRYVGKL